MLISYILPVDKFNILDYRVSYILMIQDAPNDILTSKVVLVGGTGSISNTNPFMDENIPDYEMILDDLPFQDGIII
jgi:hypothetical protein